MKKFFVFALLLLTIGCAQTAKKSVDAVVLSQETIVDIASVVDQQCTAGILTQTQCDKAAKLYSEAKDAYQTVYDAEMLVIDAAVAGLSIQGAEDQLTAAMSAWTPIAAKLITLAAEYGLIKE